MTTPSKHLLAGTVAGLLMTLAGAAQAEVLPADLVAEIETLGETWGKNPVIVAAVAQQNATGMSQKAILELDDKWRNTSGLAAFMEPYFDNQAADELARLESNADYVMESFAMDNQGGIVGATNKTSDYWQGDEAKFTESFKGGSGAVHIGEIEFDDSAQSYLVQVSVPVMKDGAAIGAITIGIDIDSFE